MKHIRLEAKEIKELSYFVVRIIEQTHRCGYFGMDSNEFTYEAPDTDSKFELISQDFPDYDQNHKRLFLLGDDYEEGKEVFLMPKEDMPLLRKAVRAYNDFFKSQKTPSSEFEIIE